MTIDILVQAKPKTIKLADGKEYTLPPIDMTTLANIETVMGYGLDKVSIKMKDEPMTTLRLLVYALLKENYPDLTIDNAGHLITLKEIAILAETISEIMAMT